MDVTYCFSRLNLLANYTDKEQFLLESMSSGATRYRNYEWAFTDIEKLEYSGENFITGFLVKYQELGEEEVVNTESMAVGQAEVPNLITGKSRFFLHIKSGLVVYNTQGSIISQEAFENRFSEIIEKYNQGIFIEAIMYTVQEEVDFSEMFAQFKSIKKISLVLHPSNPNFRNRWKGYDDRIKAIGATEYKENYITKKEEGTLKPDTEIEDKIVMAQDGYGTASASGIKNDGEEGTISTSNNPSTAQAPGNEERPDIIVSFLWIKISAIFNRFNKNENKDKDNGNT
jgi:Domain of unknown function (DUF4747)